MITAQLDQVDLIEAHVEGTPDATLKFGLALSSVNGSTTTQVVYVELEPGKSTGRHIHSADELLLVIEGEVELSVDDERRRLPAGGMSLIPSRVPHDPTNVGSETLRFVSFSPALRCCTSGMHRCSP
jgi:quercetin dioxygenase-like cupin family protein